MAQTCDYLLPPYSGHLVEGLSDEKVVPCVLKEGHTGPHLVTAKAFSGRTLYYEWEHEKECPEPHECEDLISCDHFVIWKVGIGKAKQRLKKEGPEG